MSSSTTLSPLVTLNDGVQIPQLGYGVWQIHDAKTERLVAAAIEAGYRHIDTAMIYENEAGTGAGVRASGIDREELFVTTKLWNSDQGYETTLKAFEASRKRLGLDYVDLYLIHWPCAPVDKYVDSWKAMIKLRAEGYIRSIGLSNFLPDHIVRLVDETGVTPSVNQVEAHPWFPQHELRAFHATVGIATEAWSPIGRGGDLLREPDLLAVAERHGVSPAQAVIRWHLQIGNIVIPKTETPARLAENFDVFGFELDSEDMRRIAELNRDERLGPHPERFGF